MIWSILCYALVLLAAGAFFLLYPGYVSFFALLLFLSLPLLSLLFSLLQRRRYAVGAACAVSTCRRDGRANVRFTLTTPAMDPGQAVELEVAVEPLMYPDLTTVQSLTLHPGEDEGVELTLKHCGWYRITARRCVAEGWLGIARLRLQTPPPAMVLVLPETQTPAAADIGPKPGGPLRVRPGGGPGEEYELRPYRPGDPTGAIHWKLTAKQPNGDPVLRETLEPVKEHIVIVYHHFGAPEDLDDILDQLEGLSRLLIDKDIPFTVAPVSGDERPLPRYTVDCQRAWDACYQGIAALPVPREGSGSGSAPDSFGLVGPVKQIHLTPRKKKGVSAP